ncbi:glucose 1-dehydrogenase [Pontibacter korlensis]|uniref:Ketoacyl reductase n=1 Tax=Pontibacter korlensis TaxID=400092 RepID=A0A0E3ZD50_9BACT|nr:glucose 1-dehydrogenase [Pontibacter korlensis]AKD02210.1 hypothetical protein PKOR_02515 [Pontibacter korlensis]
MEIDLNEKVALVTGGSKGIGKGIAEALAAAGANVVICARNQQELEQTASEIADKTGARVVAITADVTNQQDVERLVQQTLEQVGEVNILVNNAGGIGKTGTFDEVEVEVYEQLYDLNVVSMVRLTKAVLPAMRSKKWGRIINISSENGLQPYPDMLPYDMTKAAIINFSKGLSKELGEHGILVNTVSPAFITTPLVDQMLQGQAEKAGITKEQAEKDFLEQKRPDLVLKRAGTIEEVGAAVAFLASDQASFITGTNLRVDGGSVSSI